jgi:lipoic acid synthetase
MTSPRLSKGFPPWLKKRVRTGPKAREVRALLDGLRLNTVCSSALCPNIGECFHKGTATFLLMGPHCTRSCRFCGVGKKPPAPVETDEPERVAEASKKLALRHVVVTSVTRDDLADGGAGHFARTIRAIRERCGATVEVLVPDFGGSTGCIETVLAAGPDVFNHNVETVPRLYRTVRPEAGYERSLTVLRHAAEMGKAVTKSGLMVGIGETTDEVDAVLADMRRAAVEVLTVGQYLSPSKAHLPVERFWEPGEFEALERRAMEMGFAAARCGPFVRSSYCAEEVFSAGVSRKGV